MRAFLTVAKITFMGIIICSIGGFVKSEEIKTFSYGEHPRQKLDVLPKVGDKQYPVLIFIHGGGWVTGTKNQYPFLLKRIGQEGFVTVAANYRLSPDVVFPKFVEDGASAVAWVAENISKHGDDPKQIYLMGHSAGARTVSLLGLDERYLKQVKVDQSSIKGVIPISCPFMLKPSQVPKMKFIFGDVKDEEIAPLQFIDGNEPPFLILQGENDSLVQSIHGKVAEKKFREKGGKVQKIDFANYNHFTIIMPRFWGAKGELMATILQWIRENE